MFLNVNIDYFLNIINNLFFITVKCGVLFEVRTEFLTSIQMNFGLRGFIGQANYRSSD
jgi:hypothetical protein